MLAKAVKNRRRAQRRKGSPFPTVRDRGRDLDNGDSSQIDLIGRAAMCKAANPGGADLLDVPLNEVLESTKYPATSAPFADDGFRQRFSLDRDREVIGIVVVDILAGIGKMADEAAGQHLLMDFG